MSGLIPGYDRWRTSGDRHRHSEEITCKRCGHTWTIEGWVEYGGFFPDSDANDEKCLECGKEVDHDQI